MMTVTLCRSSRLFVVGLACALAGVLVGAAPQRGAGGGPGQGQQGGPAPGGNQGGGGQGPRGGVPGQNPARDLPNQPPATGTASIAGVVTVSGSGAPVRRAQVNLSGGGLRGQRTTMTNDQGRFSFLALPAGRFNLNVSKPGYVGVSYGAKKPGRQGTPIQLVDGQALTNASVSLPKGSVITGVVMDEFGEPSPNTAVRAFRFASQSGQRTLQSAGQGQTDDRGIYRIFQLQPGDYLVSAVPRNQGVGDFAAQIQSQLQPLLQQVQAAGGVGPLLGGAGGGAAAFGNILGGGRGQQLADQVQQLQQQLGQQAEQPQAYAPVYFPGTATPGQAGRITLGVGEERAGVDFQLQLVPTAKVSGRVVSPDGTLPPGAQVNLQIAGQQDVPTVPGLGSSMTRIGPDGTFAFQSVTPGPYTLMVRAPVRQTDSSTPQDPQAAVQNLGRGAGGRLGVAGPGGRGPGGPITQVLWASTDVTVDGRDLSDLTLNLQPGMTLSGRVVFTGSSVPPADLSAIRVNLRPLDQQAFGGAPPALQVDASGNFSMAGVVPGRYAIGANVATGGGRGAQGVPGAVATPVQTGGTWSVKSALVNGIDAMDFPLDVKPNESISGVLLTFTDSTQELSGVLQDSMGRPTPDYTIVLFPVETRYWIPQSRRIMSARPSTDGTFTFRGFPAGQYHLTAVTDAEPGEWYDPAFLSQVVSASMSLTVADGEKKRQDIRLAGGGL